MALRLTFGIDPGLSGAIATLIDGEPGPMLDMPTCRVDGKNEVCAFTLAAWIREQRAAHPGAYVSACLELVSAAPMGGRRQGTASMFAFGDGYGQVKAVLRVLNIPTTRVTPQVWKRHFHIAGKTKDPDAGRQMAIARFPGASDRLKRKKDSGRADALWLALWHDQTEQTGARAA
ncbi:hypothetical protein [Lysobacter sp. F6437]|uniref:hypothetical protein n=1 Tax=Lysobacter sp. F6437 TaxID=3459296 RepID=UPI00403D7D09